MITQPVLGTSAPAMENEIGTRGNNAERKRQRQVSDLAHLHADHA
jgi:hypothetical protein